MPPLRRVTSCSPSASARTVTAHSLKAIGIEEVVVREGPSYLRSAARKPACDAALPPWGRASPDGSSHTMHKLPRSHNLPANHGLSLTYKLFPLTACQSRTPASPSTASSTAAKS